LKAYVEKKIDNGLVDNLNICMCYFRLGKFNETADVLVRLISGENRDFLIALQISSDLFEVRDAYFLENLMNCLKAHSIESLEVVDKREKVLKILSGSFNENCSLKFLSQNNRANKDTISQIKSSWDGKNSIIHNAILNSYALMHAGTLDDTYFSDPTNKQWVGKSTHWAEFLSIGCLGTIHRNNTDVTQAIAGFIPAGQQNDKFKNGGKHYAIGLALAGTKDTDKLNKLTDVLNDNAASNNEPVVHGACLGLGLIGYASADLTLVERLKTFLYCEKATIGEAAGYAIGLIMTGKIDDDLMNELIRNCYENTHEKIVRAIALAIGLMCFNNEEQADKYINKLLECKDQVVRYGGALAIGMAYCGTSNNRALKKLLSLTASDVSDDVRRASTMSIGYLMINDYEQIFKMIS